MLKVHDKGFRYYPCKLVLIGLYKPFARHIGSIFCKMKTLQERLQRRLIFSLCFNFNQI